MNQQMLDFAAKGGLTRYPMLDNVTQGDVVNTGNKFLPSLLAGKTSVPDGLSQMQSTLEPAPGRPEGHRPISNR